MDANPGGNSSSAGPPHTTDPISILHVDDQVDFAEMAAQFLEMEHGRFDVETAPSASDALELLSGNEFDCVVSDYQMPGKDGIEFLKKVREAYPNLPFILFTGKGSEEVAGEAISAGVTDYLQKEVGTDQFTVLANRIENAVQQVRTEHRLEESQRRFRTLLSNVPGMAYRCRNERSWPMLFVSDDAVEITGYSQSELVDGEVSYGEDVIHPEDQERIWDAVQSALEAGEPFRVEYRIQTADDEERWVWEQGQGVYENGEPVVVEGFITDVTERKESQEQLEYQSSLLEAQLETTIDGLLIVNDDRTVVSYNDRFVEMWDIPDALVETKSDEALLEWVLQNKVAEPDAFMAVVEDLYERPTETSRDEVALTDGRVFDRYSSPVIGEDGTNYGRLWVFRDITERKDREQQLKRQDFLFSRVQTIADVGAWEYDPEADTLTWSDGIRQIHGVDDDYEPTLEDAINFYHPEDREKMATAINSAIEEGEEYDLELRIVRPNGTVRDIRTQGEVSRNEQGDTELIRGVFQDITKRKERERELQIYEYASQSALSAIAIADFDGELLSVNPAFCEMWGYEDKTEVLGRSVTDFWVEPESAASVVTAVKEKGRWEGELQAVREDGTTFDAYSSASFVTDEDGEPIALMSSFVDITDRKQHEQELEEEREKYATLVQQSHDGVAIIQDHEFVFVNSRLAEITGYEESELLGMPFTETVAPEDQQLVQERYERRLQADGEEPPSRYTLAFETKDGRNRDVEVSASAVQFEGSPADLASLRDVTERQRYEAELERLNEELEVLNRVVRHDIRHDMAVILGWAELLEDHVDEAGAEHLEKILTSSNHIVELTETTRDYVETLTNDEKLDVNPTRLQQILSNEITIRKETYPDAEIRLDEPVPAVSVQANEMLSSVFRNLLNNAVLHNDKDRPVVEVTVEERTEDVSVAVADNGPGIPKGQREKVFGKDEMSLESSGTGTGLYLVQKLIDQYGGDIRIKDNEPEGTVFTVTLPKAE